MAGNPKPGAWTTAKGARLKLLRARPPTTPPPARPLRPEARARHAGRPGPGRHRRRRPRPRRGPARGQGGHARLRLGRRLPRRPPRRLTPRPGGSGSGRPRRAGAVVSGRRPAAPGVAARALAIEALVRVEGGAYSNLVLPRLLRDSGLDGRDRALVTDLVYGTLRHQGQADHLLARASHRPLPDLDPPVRAALRLGTYQLLSGTAPHAARERHRRRPGGVGLAGFGPEGGALRQRRPPPGRRPRARLAVARRRRPRRGGGADLAPRAGSSSSSAATSAAEAEAVLASANEPPAGHAAAQPAADLAGGPGRRAGRRSERRPGRAGTARPERPACAGRRRPGPAAGRGRGPGDAPGSGQPGRGGRRRAPDRGSGSSTWPPPPAARPRPWPRPWATRVSSWPPISAPDGPDGSGKPPSASACGSVQVLAADGRHLPLRLPGAPATRVASTGCSSTRPAPASACSAAAPKPAGASTPPTSTGSPPSSASSSPARWRGCGPAGSSPTASAP